MTRASSPKSRTPSVAGDARIVEPCVKPLGNRVPALAADPSAILRSRVWKSGPGRRAPLEPALPA